jgi:hypothetical protein
MVVIVVTHAIQYGEKGYTSPAGFSRADLDHFVDDVGLLIDKLVRELTDADYNLTYVSRDTGYF